MNVRPYQRGDLAKVRPAVPGNIPAFEEKFEQAFTGEDEFGVVGVVALVPEGTALRACAWFSEGWSAHLLSISSLIRRFLRGCKRQVVVYTQCDFQEGETFLAPFKFRGGEEVPDYMGTGMTFRRWHHDRP